MCILLYLTYLYMLVSIISQPLVHLVTDAQRVMFDTQVGDHLEFFCLVNLWKNKCVRGVYVQEHILKRDTTTGKCLTLPSGLLGVLITMAFVRGVNLLASSSAERTQSPLDGMVSSSTFLNSTIENKGWFFFFLSTQRERWNCWTMCCKKYKNVHHSLASEVHKLPFHQPSSPSAGSSQRTVQ